jgi:hypothetical protein
MYENWDELRAGYTKSLWWAFGSPAGAIATIGALGFMYVLPPAAALITGSRIGALGYAAAVTSRLDSAARTGGRVWPDALTHPASVVALGWLTAESWRARQAGTVSWKGRSVSWGSDGVRSSRQYARRTHTSNPSTIASRMVMAMSPVKPPGPTTSP